MILHSDDPIAPVGYLKLIKIILENKLPALDLSGRLSGLPLKDNDGYITDYGVDACDSSEDEDDNNGCRSAQLNTLTYDSRTIEQNPMVIQSLDGWVWLGGIQGHGSDIQEAMKDASTKLTCRYANCIYEYNSELFMDQIVY